MADRSFGPLDRDQFSQLVAAPFGEAAKAIRKHDPLWNRKEGDEIKWLVTATRDVTEEGTAFVHAATKEEAKRKAGELKWSDYSVDYPYDVPDFDIDDVEPAP